MPTLENPKHEAFAQGLAKGLSASVAYVAAGYRESRSSASRLSTNANIVARVAELQAMVAERVVVDRQWVLSKLIENATNTQETNPSASNKALELIGKEIGMFVDRTENLNTNYNISDQPLTEEEWSSEYATEH